MARKAPARRKLASRSKRSRQTSRKSSARGAAPAVDLVEIPKAKWDAAKARERWVKAAIRRGIEPVAREAGCTERTLGRWIARYRLNPTLLTLIPRRRGPTSGSRRLEPKREDIVSAAIETWRKSREPIPISRAIEEVARLAKTRGVKSVARGTVVRRLAELVRVPKSARTLRQRVDETPRTRRALGVVQADHTVVDLVVVDELERRPIGRPWITIIFDIATRVVLGFHVSLEAPSATSVGLALTMACLPKARWLKEVGVDVDWPFCGLPEVLHLDNAVEFHSEALRRGCNRYGIELTYRPRGRPHTGGHIERYLGTLMRRVHGLPGTTFSNVKARGKYPSEKRATLTLRELETWLTLEIAGRYHSAIHRGLHCSPTDAWRRATEGAVPGPPKNPESFTVDFLPLVHRKIGRGGFQLFHIRYWDPLLPRIFPSSQRQIVRVNPRNLSRVATSACTVKRRRQDIQRIADAPYLVKFQSRGEALWSQRNREVHLRPGDFVVCSTAEPYSLQFFDSFEMPVLAIAPEIMKRLTPDPDQFLGVRFCGQDADCGLLSSFVAQVASRIGALQGAMIRRAEANIIDLLGGVLTSRAQSAPLSAAQHLAQVKAYIADHLSDRDLSPASVAATLRLSPRYIHALFENEPVTVGRYIRLLRVEACRRALEQPGSARITLTDLAVTWGFYDLSHMSRAFRQELGMTPSEVRSVSCLVTDGSAAVPDRAV